MPQPAILTPGSGPATVKFGGLPLPNGQGAMAYLNLNDLANWRTQSIQIDNTNRVVGLGQQVWLGRGAYMSDDYRAKLIKISADYDEGTTFGGAGLPISSQKALLGQAGTQYLTFDQLTALQVRLQSFGTPAPLRKNSPWLWRTTLSFIAATSFATDLAATIPAGSPWALTGNTSGAVTTFSFAYAGSVFTMPTWTLNVPNTNTVPIKSVILQNTMSGDKLTIVFPNNLAASTAWTITINCAAQTVVDQNSLPYDMIGSFPFVYGPATQSNAFSATVVTASGTSTGLTLGASYSNTWEF